MEREKLDLSNYDELSVLFWEDEETDEYKVVYGKQTSFDSEKGFMTKEIVIERLIDGKFFKGEGVNKGQGRIDMDSTWVQVFPEIVTTIKYR